MKEQPTEIGVHSDAADLGWTGTISEALGAGVNGDSLQGIRASEDHSKTITFRELAPFVMKSRNFLLQAAQRPPVK